MTSREPSQPSWASWGNRRICICFCVSVVLLWMSCNCWPPKMQYLTLSISIVIVLDGNQLTGTIPSELGSSVQAERFYFCEYGPLFVMSCGRLLRRKQHSFSLFSFVLMLDGNQLTGTIPPEFGSLLNLDYLWIRKCSSDIVVSLATFVLVCCGAWNISLSLFPPHPYLYRQQSVNRHCPSRSSCFEHTKL